jgi:hypothetical protein
MSSKNNKVENNIVKKKNIKLNINPKLFQNNIILAPCSFCNRKPGFYSGGINYCWIHWNKKNERNNKKI